MVNSNSNVLIYTILGGGALAGVIFGLSYLARDPEEQKDPVEQDNSSENERTACKLKMLIYEKLKAGGNPDWLIKKVTEPFFQLADRVAQEPEAAEMCFNALRDRSIVIRERLSSFSNDIIYLDRREEIPVIVSSLLFEMLNCGNEAVLSKHLEEWKFIRSPYALAFSKERYEWTTIKKYFEFHRAMTSRDPQFGKLCPNIWKGVDHGDCQRRVCSCWTHRDFGFVNYLSMQGKHTVRLMETSST